MRYGVEKLSLKFYHCQYSKLLYLPMFPLPKSIIYQFAKVLPRQWFCAILYMCINYVQSFVLASYFNCLDLCCY